MATRQRKPKTALAINTAPVPGDPHVRHGLFGNGHTGVEYLTRSTPSDKLAVTFSHYGHLDLSLPGFAEDFLLKRGYDVLTLKCNINNWFQDFSAEELQAIVRQLPDYEEVIAYGSSMGGYAAIYFSAALNARTCIALSPQYSIDPRIVPFEGRWLEDAKRISFTHAELANMVKQSQTTYYVLYDPATQDKQHVDLMLAASNRVIPVQVPFSGHPSGLVLQEMGLLADTFDNLVKGRVPDLKAKMREGRSKSASYLYALAQKCLSKGHHRTAEGLIAKASEITDRPDIILGYSRILLQQGKVGSALESLNKAWPQLQGDPHLIAYRAHLQHLNGDLDAAFRSFDEAIRKDNQCLAFYTGERLMFREAVRNYENEKRLLKAALARARAELAMRQGQGGQYSRSLLVAFALAPLLILAILAAVAIIFRLV